ncbi:hypothetical protein [Massilia sp. GCM10023247]|uniref:hypothetical protein n=1 Tax=Massilia sp. GCM10023247 TaxID=3252643 RepID=UPI0036122A04
MTTKKAKAGAEVKTQEVCIDLPGESVQCWRSSDSVRVILRKHRDVFFDINLKKDSVYTVESKHEFYSPREKKLVKKATFFDGERLNIWVGREFKGRLVLKTGDAVIGEYEVTKLDNVSYGADPKNKPEPLLVIMGHKKDAETLVCTPSDPLGAAYAQLAILPIIDPKLPFLAGAGSNFNYAYPQQPPEVKEYAALAEVRADQIQPEVLAKLESGAVTSHPSEIFVVPNKGDENSHLHQALGAAATYIAGNENLTSNWFKESAGYVQENFRSLDKIAMSVRIEKKAKGKYRALIKGKPLTQLVAQSLGAGKARVAHHNGALGSAGTGFIDGGFGKSGKSGYGGARRIMMTAAENFKGGMKIQVVGTVIDIFVDAHSVYFDEKGSRDLSEFLGRAGVSIAKAGLTAAVGSVLAAVGIMAVTATAAALWATAAPVWAAVAVVVGGYILAATLVDMLDNRFGIKQTVANMAR